MTTTCSHVNYKTFDIFGKKQMNKNSYNMRLMNGLSLVNNVEESFVECCLKILDNNSSDVNRIKLNFLIQYLIQRGYEYTMDIIIRMFQIYFDKVSLEIQNSLDNESFNPLYFLDKYDNINKNTYNLARNLNYIDKNIINENKSNRSTILVVKSYMFYNTIINRLYRCNDKNMYIYEILSDSLQQSQKMDELSRLFKIIQFYNKLSFVVREDREKYFNLDLNNKFVLKVGDASNKLLEMISNVMNENIKNLLKVTDMKIIEEKINEIRDLINMGSNIVEDKTLFMLLYRANLSERLLNKQTNADIENELLTSLNYFDNPDIYAKMKYQINDIKSSKHYNETYKKINVQVKSEKYKNLDANSLNKEKADFTVARSYAWDLKDDETLNVPPEVSVYFDIFNGYYKSKYPDRELNCQYDKSTSVVRLELNNKIYNIHMTLPQLIVLTVINNSGTISAINISKQLNMPLRRLGGILNSLIAVKLLNREEGAANDPNLLFSLNQNCSFLEENVSLISLMRKNKCENEISDTVLKAEILSFIAQNENTTLENIMLFLEEKLKLKIEQSRVNNILQQQIKSNVVKSETNLYSLNDELED